MKGKKVDGFDAHHRNPGKGTIGFKHALLRRYLPAFAGKVGKNAPDRTVHYFDGYAGTGRFSDGSPAGAAHTLKMIEGLAGAGRRFVPTYVEKDVDHFGKLKALVQEDEEAYADSTVVCGTAEEHLGHAAVLAALYPWFVFMDPYGMAVPFSTLARYVLSRPNQIGRQTELLMLYSLEGVRRSAGHLTSDKGQDSTVQSVTEFLGTDAWKTIWLNEHPDRRDDLMLDLYLENLRGYGFTPVTVAMRDDPGDPIAYKLVFCTRHPEGLWTFFDKLGWAHEEWCEDRGAPQGPPGPDDQLSLFAEDNEAPRIDFNNDWRPNPEALQEHVTSNARSLVRERGEILPQRDWPSLYGDARGVARALHILRALRDDLHDEEGLIAPRPKGRAWHKSTYSLVVS